VAALLAAGLLAGACGGVHAQDAHDARAMPGAAAAPVCSVLSADSDDAAPGGVRDDAPRIQAAIDKCAPGRAVVLAPSNAQRRFLAGPLRLKDGVTLVLDPGATLESFPAAPRRNPRPQLGAQQAKAYDVHEVLRWAGPVGAERSDPWDPLADPLATGARFTPDYTVDARARADGVTRFSSVQAAVGAALTEPARTRRVYIRLAPGVYDELLYVPAGAPLITLYSEDPDPRATRITARLDASTSGAAYRQRYAAQFDKAAPAVRAMFDALKDLPALQTTGSSSAWIRADGFQARNVTFENAYDRATPPLECSGDCPDTTGGSRVHHQAVALRVDGADRVQFENVRLHGRQDTLFLSSKDGSATVRSFFNKSYVEGDVDFIFGDTIAYFQDCEVRSIGGRPASYALAPDTSRRAKYGFVFNRCRFTHDAGKAGGNATSAGGTPPTRFYLARQWFHNQRCTPYGRVAVDGYACRLGEVDVYRAPVGTIRKRTLESVGKAVILNSRIGAHIDKAAPWSEWNRNGTLAHRPAQFSSDDWWDNLERAGFDPATVLGEGPRPAPADIYLGEYNNTIE